MRFLTIHLLAVCGALGLVAIPHAAEAKHLMPKPGDKIVLIGNTFAERMQYFGYCESLWHARFPEHRLVVRNLGWSADELTLRPRSKDFDDHGHTLQDHQPDIIIAAFGFNESFAGVKGLPKFKKDLTDFIRTTTTTKYNGKTPQLALLSPIANEDLLERKLLMAKRNNAQIKQYTDAMRTIAEQNNVVFVDLFTPSQKLLDDPKTALTFNGCHLTEAGYAKLAPILDQGLFGPAPSELGSVDLDKLRAEVNEKNLQHFYDYRAVNGYYIYGGRKNPFGVVNFPAEFVKLRKMVAKRDQRIWAVAQGKSMPATIDDSGTGEFVNVDTNFKRKILINPPDNAIKSFKLPDGFVINLFASEVDFPDLQNPCQFTFDGQGRLWICTMPTYPMYLPGTPPNDKILILEDTDRDGRADKQTIFAEGLHLPTGIELGDGGVYVAQQPNLVFLKDTDGDDQADVKRIILHGFDSADSHHALSAFEWGPGGALYFQEGTFHHSQVETPYGPERVKNAGIFRYEPRTEKLDIFVSYRFANPWGHVFNQWGQNFVADASGGANYYGTAFSGDVVYPQKHGGLKQFMVKQWRPTCGCEIVSSRNFPEELQGNYLLNNCIGFQGTLQYKFREDSSGFAADPVEPLLQSSDPNYRPVDLQFGPDGALYICDWYNPLVGHMQHSVRDPNRDVNHGRIWRVYYQNKPLLNPAKMKDASVPELLELLKTYEDRTRAQARLALRLHPTEQVVAAIDKWVAGLDKEDADYPRQLLEALWVCQHHDAVHPELLDKVLSSSEPNARAGATRVLCYWRDQLKDGLERLQKQVNDEHPRVRLEAIRALSFVEPAEALKAQDIAAESLLYAQDDYLKYTLQETLATLDRKAKLAK